MQNNLLLVVLAHVVRFRVQFTRQWQIAHLAMKPRRVFILLKTIRYRISIVTQTQAKQSNPNLNFRRLRYFGSLVERFAGPLRIFNEKLPDFLLVILRLIVQLCHDVTAQLRRAQLAVQWLKHGGEFFGQRGVVDVGDDFLNWKHLEVGILVFT